MDFDFKTILKHISEPPNIDIQPLFWIYCSILLAYLKRSQVGVSKSDFNENTFVDLLVNITSHVYLLLIHKKIY